MILWLDLFIFGEVEQWVRRNPKVRMEGNSQESWSDEI